MGFDELLLQFEVSFISLLFFFGNLRWGGRINKSRNKQLDF
jgi:hypothetical protein